MENSRDESKAFLNMCPRVTLHSSYFAGYSPLQEHVVLLAARRHGSRLERDGRSQGQCCGFLTRYELAVC